MGPDQRPARAVRRKAFATQAHTGLTAVAREFLSHLDNALYVALLLLTLALTTQEGWRYQDVLWFALGWLFFLPQEWLTHVYLLHWICPARERSCSIW